MLGKTNSYVNVSDDNNYIITAVNNTIVPIKKAEAICYKEIKQTRGSVIDDVALIDQTGLFAANNDGLFMIDDDKKTKVAPGINVFQKYRQEFRITSQGALINRYGRCDSAKQYLFNFKEQIIDAGENFYCTYDDVIDKVLVLLHEFDINTGKIISSYTIPEDMKYHRAAIDITPYTYTEGDYIYSIIQSNGNDYIIILTINKVTGEITEKYVEDGSSDISPINKIHGFTPDRKYLVYEDLNHECLCLLDVLDLSKDVYVPIMYENIYMYFMYNPNIGVLLGYDNDTQLYYFYKYDSVNGFVKLEVDIPNDIECSSEYPTFSADLSKVCIANKLYTLKASKEYQVIPNFFKNMEGVIIGTSLGKVNYGEEVSVYKGDLGSDLAYVSAVNKTDNIVFEGDKVWINETNGTYNLVDFSKKNYSNFSIYGSPIVDKQTGVINGFSHNDYLKIIGTFEPQTSNFEIVIASMPTDSSSSYVLAGTSGSTIAINPTKIAFLSTGGNSYNISLPLTSTIPLNTKVYTKIERVGNVFTRYSSFDGIDWVFESSATDSLSLNPVNLNIGFYGNEQYYSFVGEVYLEDTYINVDGQRWWSPVLNINNIDENTITGVAQGKANPDEEVKVELIKQS